MPRTPTTSSAAFEQPRNERRVRLGIAGCGVIGSRHIAAAHASPQIELVAVADLRIELAQALAAEHNVATVYRRAEELIRDAQVEAVVLAMPAAYRMPLALAAFAAGKHVLTEKPVALNADEVRQMLAAQGAARGSPVAACCSSRFHFLESAPIVTDLLTTGALGALRVLRCRAIRAAGPPPETTPPDWRLSRSLNGGGIMSNWGCYDLDYLLGITGWTLRPVAVSARMWSVPPAYVSHVAPGSDAETHVAALVYFENGATLTYERGEYVAARAETAWEIIGEKGALSLEMTPGANKHITVHLADRNQGTRTEVLWQGEDRAADLYTGPLNDFARAILHNQAPQTSLERALVVQSITDAIYTAATRNQTVEIPEEHI